MSRFHSDDRSYLQSGLSTVHGTKRIQVDQR